MIIQVIRGIFFLMLSADVIDMVDVDIVDMVSIHSLWNQLFVVDS